MQFPAQVTQGRLLMDQFSHNNVPHMMRYDRLFWSAGFVRSVHPDESTPASADSAVAIGGDGNRRIVAQAHPCPLVGWRRRSSLEQFMVLPEKQETHPSGQIL